MWQVRSTTTEVFLCECLECKRRWNGNPDLELNSHRTIHAQLTFLIREICKYFILALSSLEWVTLRLSDDAQLFSWFFFFFCHLLISRRWLCSKSNSQKFTNYNYCFFHRTRSITDCSIRNKHKLNEFQKLFFFVAQNQFSTSMDAIFTHLVSNSLCTFSWLTLNLMQSIFHLALCEKLVHNF